MIRRAWQNRVYLIVEFVAIVGAAAAVWLAAAIAYGVAYLAWRWIW